MSDVWYAFVVLSKDSTSTATNEIGPFTSRHLADIAGSKIVDNLQWDISGSKSVFQKDDTIKQDKS